MALAQRKGLHTDEELFVGARRRTSARARASARTYHKRADGRAAGRCSFVVYRRDSGDTAAAERGHVVAECVFKQSAIQVHGAGQRGFYRSLRGHGLRDDGEPRDRNAQGARGGYDLQEP